MVQFLPVEKLKEYTKRYRERIDDILEDFLSKKVEETDDRFNKMIYGEIKRFVLSPGKRIRPHLVLLGYEGIAGEEPDGEVLKIAAAMEMLHTYRLIHDDVIDRDEVRRNEPTLWKSVEDDIKSWGPTTRHDAFSLAILAGDILRSFIDQMIMTADLPRRMRSEIMQYIAKVDESTNRGQVLDVSLSRIPLNLVSEEDVLKVYRYKTALYSINAPLGLGAILAGEDSDYYLKFALPVGIAFQITDDILGIFGDPKTTGKPADSDIKEGKRTILIWYAWNHGSDSQRSVLERVLGNENAKERDVEKVREIIVKTGALEYARELSKEYVKEGKEALRKMDISPKALEVLLDLADYIVERNK